MMQPKPDTLDPVAGPKTLILGGHDFHSITEVVSGAARAPDAARLVGRLRRRARSRSGCLGIGVAWLFWEGIGVWGLNSPVGWALGHHQLRLLGRHRPRRHADLAPSCSCSARSGAPSINRVAEAMTIFAVMCARIFPGIHVGRVWLAYWLFPIPNQMGIWPNFRSPLLWDVFAVSTYFTVSLLFWYVGLIPDLATLRDRAKTKIAQLVYGIFALGWRGSQPPLAALRDAPT